ncbi:cytochrome P450 [Hygrophoropsis aurantiaca]|uniref:Cytochrome P450 n=1 Tax=Hygrophoropsis aurantiaca TaxID=72124 RepID=A0ACB8AJQ8_9AGAM|nr:cytochrome P450 [Hygrophoropsis aurantiaca]
MAGLTSMPMTALAVVFAVAFVISNRKKKREGPPLPPGPPPTPLVGNIVGLDPASPWLSYATWGKEYGPLLYTRFFSQEMIVINSEKIAKALMENRSHIYSDRPVIATTEPLGLGFNMVLFRYGARWRQHRRIFHQAVRPDAVIAYRPLQMQKGYQLLLDLLATPDDHVQHLVMHSGAIIMQAVYNYDTLPKDDPYMTVIEKATKIIVDELRPEVAAIMSAFPFLLHLPGWFPGMSINGRTADSMKYTKAWVEEPFKYTQKAIKDGTAGSCLVTDSMRKIEGKDDSDESTKAIKEIAATAFLAGAETTQSTLRVFILAMVLYPEVQKRAQALIDSVVGPDRLPNFDDRESLLYIDAILRETMRWNPVFPLGLPHASTEDDIYEGYYIPKGATIIPNAWAMAHDETKYSNSFEFIPERFIKPDGTLNDDQVTFAFGFGRRICVGRYFADASLWSAMALMLHTFNFGKTNDANGKEIEIDVKWSTGVAIHPLPFPCSITPRNPGLTEDKLRQLIHTSQ